MLERKNNIRWGVGGRVDATLAYRCPTCGARERDVCRYVAPAIAEGKDINRLPSLREQIDRAGKPTIVPHQARYRAMHAYQGTRSQSALARIAAARRKTKMSEDAVAIARVFAIRDAMQAADRRELDQLHAWLKDFGHILCR
jgi:hypothetical protein